MSTRSIGLDDRLYGYLLAHSLRETPLMRELREATARFPLSRMQISPEQGQFMALLVELTGATRIVEVGTFTGYSALCMAQAMPAEGRMVCCDLSEEWTAVGASFWERAGLLERIDLRIGPALDTLDGLLSNGHADGFDLAFIDADKENYAAYYERCLRLVRRGGLIVLDNMLWGGRVADPACDDAETVAIRALNSSLLDDQRVALSLLPLGDGVVLARKR